jgi:hypothetical protein
MKKALIVIVLVIGSVLLSACAAASGGSIPYASIPAGQAYADGKEIFFSHTEVSDPGVAEKLTAMMKSPVLVVPSLANASEDMLSDVYVFTNGVAGKGPLGFQPDVFDNPPGTDGYTPLRKITFVTWQEGKTSSLLTSEADILKGVDEGNLTLEKSNVVVNMPFMSWDGGKR